MTVQMSYAGGAPQLALTGNIAAADTSFVAATGGTATGYPDGSLGDFVVLIGSGEKVLCSGRSGTTFTVALGGRGYDGTSAAAWSAGAVVEHVWDATSAQEASDHINITTRDDHTQYARIDMSRVLTGSVKATNADHYFGADANGGAGTRLHVGSLGDAANAYAVAEGSAADVGLILKTKGAGVLAAKDGSDNVLATLRSSGQFSIGTIGSGGASTGPLLGISNITNLPSTPSAGGWLYVDAGALKYVGSSGTVTTLGSA